MATVPEFELKVLQAVQVLERDKGLMPAMSHELLTYLPEEDATEVIQALGRLWRAGYVEGNNEPGSA